MPPGGRTDRDHDEQGPADGSRPASRPDRDGRRRIGDLLRDTREEYGLTLADIAGVLRIKDVYLAALEQHDLDALPAAAYAIGFLRAYSDYLGLDAEDLVRRFKAEKAELRATPELNFPVPLTERGIPGSSIVMVALILCVIGYVSWNWYSAGPRSSVAEVEPVPPRLLAPPSLDPPSVPPDSAAAAEPPVRTAAPTVAAQPTAAPTTPGAAAPLQTAALPPTATDSVPTADHVFGNATSGKVVVTATGDAWVEVLDNDHPIWSRLLKPGDVYNPPKDGLTMLVGNAGGIQVSVNGRTLPPIGAAGEVRRIALDAAKLDGG